jgi:hypothetical protein
MKNNSTQQPMTYDLFCRLYETLFGPTPILTKYLDKETCKDILSTKKNITTSIESNAGDIKNK